VFASKAIYQQAPGGTHTSMTDIDHHRCSLFRMPFAQYSDKIQEGRKQIHSRQPWFYNEVSVNPHNPSMIITLTK
jgi:hypothetical protein